MCRNKMGAIIKAIFVLGLFVLGLLVALSDHIAKPAPPRAELAIVANCIICGQPVTNAAYRYPGVFDCGCEDRGQTAIKRKEKKGDEEVGGSLIRISALFDFDPRGR